jgi:hypothetical protein
MLNSVAKSCLDTLKPSLRHTVLSDFTFFSPSRKYPFRETGPLFFLFFIKLAALSAKGALQPGFQFLSPYISYNPTFSLCLRDYLSLPSQFNYLSTILISLHSQSLCISISISDSLSFCIVVRGLVPVTVRGFWY